MALGMDSALRDARLDAIDTFIGNAGKLKIYDGSRPATGGAATNLLGTLTLGSPAFGAASGATMTANAITQDASADATGTATWFRITKSDDSFVMDGSVGTSGADLNLNTTSIVAGGPIAVTSLVLTEGNP